MNWYKKAQEKIMYITRGISGSGKSTLAKSLGENGVVFSADDFFMVNGEYQFDPEKIKDAHIWNQLRAFNALKNGISPIVVDDTNLEAWEMQPYVKAAQKMGYKIEIREPNTPWKFDSEILAKKNKHDVPKDVIEEMIKRYQPNVTIEDILNTEPPEGITQLEIRSTTPSLKA